MADPVALSGEVRSHLLAVPGLTADRLFEGYVPTKLPTDAAGYILPYVVVFYGIGGHPNERTSRGDLPGDALRFDFQTTCVGPSASHAVALARDVRTALLNKRVGTGWIIPNPDGMAQQYPLPDTSITPARFFLPPQWRVTTN